MGTVWLAERSDGRFERKVAVKFPHISLGGRGGEERFKREGSIVGRLAHPNIAELVDAGVSAAGQPYLVLEYVDGEPIDQYCRNQALNFQARIRLFLDVLSAVAHAHTNLIVHRDIKPTNVLVDRSGQVKLLDFGIAKLLEDQGQGAEATLLTREGGSVLTPEYAAPEQVTGAPVTTATDVYSLGVLLFVLLSGQHPAGPGPHSPANLVKAIVDTEAPRASEAITPELAGILAAVDATTADKIRRRLRGDLDTIVAKALKKNPQERYASVGALAADLEHYLKQEPISARPDTVAYRAAKFVGRNRAAVVLASLALAAVIAGVATTLIQARSVRQQRDLAVRERDRANRITQFMTSMFKVADPSENVGNGVTVREVLDKASKDVNTGLANDPKLQAEMMDVMGTVYSNLGLYPQARALLERAVEVSRTINGPQHPETLRAMGDLASVLVQQNQGRDAEKLQREVLEADRRILGSDHPDTLSALSGLASTLAMEGQLSEAEKLGREALAKQSRVLGLEDRQTIATMDNLAAMLGEEGHFAESADLEKKTIDIETRVYGPDHLGVLNSMGNLADSLYYLGRYAEAQEEWQKTLAIQRRVLGPDHPATARSIYNLGCLAAREGKRDQAFTLLGQAIDHLSPREVPQVADDPDLASLHSDRRFAGLVARAKSRGPTGDKCPL
jgi:tetratricopeptide (TPR) repeat protein